MTNEKMISLLSFAITALGLLSLFPPLAAYSEWFIFAASLVGAFIGSWYGVKPIVQARSAGQPADPEDVIP